MRRDGHEVSVAAPTRVINFERATSSYRRRRVPMAPLSLRQPEVQIDGSRGGVVVRWRLQAIRGKPRESGTSRVPGNALTFTAGVCLAGHPELPGAM